jgi:hypothetical protein
VVVDSSAVLEEKIKMDDWPFGILRKNRIDVLHWCAGCLQPGRGVLSSSKRPLRGIHAADNSPDTLHAPYTTV